MPAHAQPQAAGRRLTREEEELGARLFAEGKSEREVARALDCGAGTAHRLKKRLDRKELRVAATAAQPQVTAAEPQAPVSGIASLEARRAELVAERAPYVAELARIDAELVDIDSALQGARMSEVQEILEAMRLVQPQLADVRERYVRAMADFEAMLTESA